MSKGKLVFSVILLWLGRFSVLVVGTDEESGGLMLISSIHSNTQANSLLLSCCRSFSQHVNSNVSSSKLDFRELCFGLVGLQGALFWFSRTSGSFVLV